MQFLNQDQVCIFNSLKYEPLGKSQSRERKREPPRHDEKYFARKWWFSAGNFFLIMCSSNVLGWSEDVLKLANDEHEIFPHMEMVECMRRIIHGKNCIPGRNSGRKMLMGRALRVGPAETWLKVYRRCNKFLTGPLCDGTIYDYTIIQFDALSVENDRRYHST